MKWTNFHMHSHYCDGVGQLESYVRKAIDKKMFAIGFSSHAPVPFDTDWHMKMEALERYIEEIHALRKKYEKEINLSSGLEVDYIPGVIGPGSYRKKPLDIIIGSVHYVGQLENGEYCCIDNTKEEFETGLETIFENDIEKLVSAYYEIMISMIKNDTPDLIGHIDVIKKLNNNNRYFSEEARWYQDLISRVIGTLSTSNCIVEVNTRGYYKGITKTFSPGKQILKKCFDAGIRVTISSDAHHPDEIVLGFKDASSVLLNIGYKHIHVFFEGKWRAMQLRGDGSGLSFPASNKRKTD